MRAELCDRLLGFGAILRDHDAFSRCQTIGLNDHREPEVIEAGTGPGGGNPCPFEELFGENLRAFEPGSGLGGSDNLQTTVPETIDDAGDERRFGADDREIDVVSFGDIGIAGDVVWSRNTVRELRNARVARTGNDALHEGRFRQPPGESMFPAAAAHNKDLQKVIPSLE